MINAMPSLSTIKPPQPQFSGTIPTAVVQTATHQLSGMRNVSINRLIKTIDFKEMGISTIPQMMTIYAFCLMSRMYNASRRSKNELREQVTRDSMGYSFWFFGAHILQRVFLKFFAPHPYQQALLEIKKAPAEGKFLELNTKQKLQMLNWHINPLARFTLPSSKQVREQWELARHQIEQAGFHAGSLEFNQVQDYYKNLIKWRQFATGLGHLATIGLIGIGINLYNIHITRKKVHAQQLAQMGLQPQPQSNPFWAGTPSATTAFPMQIPI